MKQIINQRIVFLLILFSFVGSFNQLHPMFKGTVAELKKAAKELVDETREPIIEGAIKIMAAKTEAMEKSVKNILAESVYKAHHDLLNEQFTKQVIDQMVRQLGQAVTQETESKGHLTAAFNNIKRQMRKEFFIASSLATIPIGLLVAGYGAAKLGYKKFQKRGHLKKFIMRSAEQSTAKKRALGHEQKNVYNPAIEKELHELTITAKLAKTAHENGNQTITYEKILLTGKPGCGKKTFAQELARRSGMRLVIISGSRLAHSGTANTITQLAKRYRNKKGSIVFIDQCDAIQKNAPIFAELMQLVKNNKELLVILSTNNATDIDPLIFQAIDREIAIPLPEQLEREKLLQNYKQQAIAARKNSALFSSAIDKILSPARIAMLSQQTAGFSAQELKSLVNQLAFAAQTNQPASAIDMIIERAIQKRVKAEPVNKG